MKGFKFFRQYNVYPYILDFFCPVCRLAIELDGSQHTEAKYQLYDIKRSEYLAKQNIKVLRFWDNEVFQNTEGIWEKIAEEIDKLHNPS